MSTPAPITNIGARTASRLSGVKPLLVEAHHEPDTPLVTIMFLVGFLGLLALEIPNG
jgi:hypothetical protein